MKDRRINAICRHKAIKLHFRVKKKKFFVSLRQMLVISKTFKRIPSALHGHDIEYKGRFFDDLDNSKRKTFVAFLVF